MDFDSVCKICRNNVCDSIHWWFLLCDCVDGDPGTSFQREKKSSTFLIVAYLFSGVYQWNCITGHSRFSVGYSKDCRSYGYTDFIFIGRIFGLETIGHARINRTNATIFHCDLHTRNTQLLGTKWSWWWSVQVYSLFLCFFFAMHLNANKIENFPFSDHCSGYVGQIKTLNWN